MKRMSGMLGMVVLAVALILPALAQASSVNYTVTGLGPTNYPGPYPPPDGAPHLLDGYGYPGDAVGLVSYTGTLNLVPGTYVQKINTLTWSVSYTYNGTDNDWTNDGPPPKDWPELQFDINADRTLSFDTGPTGAITQSGVLTTNWFDDSLGFSDGSASTFYVAGYRIDVTPLGVAEVGVSVWNGNPPCDQPDRDIMASFVVTAVPLPAAVWAGMPLLGALVGLRLRRRRLA